jgi:VWFA-related protein
MRRVPLFVALGLAVAGSAVAQQRTTLPNFGGEVKVNNITVDVEVHDAQGIPVQGLRQGDFRILEDGAPQRLTNFLAVSGGLVDRAQDASLVGQPAPREVVLFFDEYLMTEADKRQVVKGFREAFGYGLPPAMTVAVVSFDGTLRVHTPPTASRERVLEALKQVERVPATGLQRQITLSTFDTSNEPRRERWAQYDFRRMQNEEYWSEMRSMVGRVESAFTAAAERFAASPARKIIILVSPGFPRAQNVPLYRTYDFFIDTPPEYRNNGLLARAARLASDLEYTLYTVDPSGNQGLDAGASSGRPAAFNDVANVNFWREADRKDTLIQAATLTGGRALFTSDASAAVADVERLTSAFYSLGYQPDHFGDGKQYEVKVEVVGHPEFRLTYRTVYVDRPFDEREAERSRAALLTGETANPLGVELVLSTPKSHFRLGAEGLHVYTIPAELRIPYAKLAMLPRGPVSWGEVQVVVVAVDARGNQSELAHQTVPIQIPSAKLEEARQKGYFAFAFTLEVEGGPRSIRIAVNDVLARTTSTVITDLRL